jgi:DNA repair protein RadC
MTIAEYHCVALREQAMSIAGRMIDSPDKVFDWFQSEIRSSPRFTPGVENFCVLHANTRRRITGWMVISTGTLDTLLVHPREVFRAAIVANAAAVILAHNHPSGESTPSGSDIKVTRDMIRAGQLLKIDVLDHVIIGDMLLPEASRQWCSLKELGYFYS